jgi:hypothetical protein
MVFSRDICGLKHRLSITRTFNDNTALQLTSEAVAGPTRAFLAASSRLQALRFPPRHPMVTTDRPGASRQIP